MALVEYRIDSRKWNGKIRFIDILVAFYEDGPYEFDTSPVSFTVYNEENFVLNIESKKLLEFEGSLIGAYDDDYNGKTFDIIRKAINGENVDKLELKDGTTIAEYKKDLREILGKAGIHPTFILLTSHEIIKEIIYNDCLFDKGKEDDVFKNFKVFFLSTKNLGYLYICDNDTVIIAIEELYQYNAVAKCI